MTVRRPQACACCQRREPEVDHVPWTAPPVSAATPVAVARDRQPRAERDHGGIDGDDARGRRHAGRRAAAAWRTRSADGDRPRAARGRSADAAAGGDASSGCVDGAIAADRCCGRLRLAPRSRRCARRSGPVDAARPATKLRRAAAVAASVGRALLRPRRRARPAPPPARRAARRAAASRVRAARACSMIRLFWPAARLRLSSPASASSSESAPSRTRAGRPGPAARRARGRALRAGTRDCERVCSAIASCCRDGGPRPARPAPPRRRARASVALCAPRARVSSA